MLDAVRADVSARLTEVFQLLEHIRSQEETPPTPDSAEVKILRGLFYVHLYAALEFSVNQGVQRFLDTVSAMGIPPQHLEEQFFSVALDSAFTACRNVGEDKRWASRINLLELQSSGQPRIINGALFGLYLQNIWCEKLDILFKCLNIQQPITPDPTYRTYVDELVERRNSVAHGRVSTLGLGSARRSPDLLIRYNAISATCIHILDCIDQQHARRQVIRQQHRSAYP
jgi:hypothetical protein